MKFSRSVTLCVVIFLITVILPGVVSSQENSDKQLAENVVTKLYGLVTFEAGKEPDWEAVKALFIDEAVIALRESREGLNIYTKQGFVDSFIKFIKSDYRGKNVLETGFIEKITKIDTQVYGDFALCNVLYQPYLADMQPTYTGLDCFQLLKKDGEWKIAAIMNEIIRPGVPVPDRLKGDSSN